MLWLRHCIILCDNVSTQVQRRNWSLRQKLHLLAKNKNERAACVRWKSLDDWHEFLCQSHTCERLKSYMYVCLGRKVEYRSFEGTSEAVRLMRFGFISLLVVTSSLYLSLSLGPTRTKAFPYPGQAGLSAVGIPILSGFQGGIKWCTAPHHDSISTPRFTHTSPFSHWKTTNTKSKTREG